MAPGGAARLAGPQPPDDPALEAGRRLVARQQREQFLLGNGQVPDTLPAGIAPVQVKDGLRPLPAGEHAQREFRGHLSEVVAVHLAQPIHGPRSCIARSLVRAGDGPGLPGGRGE
ncbi:MAG TPA: hypothetical protein VGN41_10780 [Streptosporangiaceae bacterium]|jgi:hypothetical protein